MTWKLGISWLDSVGLSRMQSESIRFGWIQSDSMVNILAKNAYLIMPQTGNLLSPISALFLQAFLFRGFMAGMK